MPPIKKQPTKAVRQNQTGAAPFQEFTGDVAKLIGHIEEDELIKCQIYGESGSGKTTTWATFPKPILCLIRSGLKRPGELRSLSAAQKKDIKPSYIKSSDQVKALIDFQNETNTFKTVVLDHMSGLQDRILAEVMGLEQLPAGKHWGMAKREQYGTAAIKCKEIFRAILDLNCNVVMIAQQREFKTDNDSAADLIPPTYGADLMPALKAWLDPCCDYIFQAFKRSETRTVVATIGDEQIESEVPTGGVQYCLRTGPHAYFNTKFRVPKGTPLPEYIVDPDYDKIMSVVRGEGVPE